MTSKCKQFCSVPQCSNYRSATVSMHFFPKDFALKKRWAVALRIGKAVTSGMMVCSDHFQRNDFFPCKF